MTSKELFEVMEKNAKYILELEGKIEELEKVIKTGKCKHIKENVISAECSLCHLAWCELRIKVLEKKLQKENKE